RYRRGRQHCQSTARRPSGQRTTPATAHRFYVVTRSQHLLPWEIEHARPTVRPLVRHAPAGFLPAPALVAELARVHRIRGARVRVRDYLARVADDRYVIEMRPLRLRIHPVAEVAVRAVAHTVLV